MKQRLLFLLTLLVATATGARVDSLEQNADNNYLVGSVGDWQLLASLVNESTDAINVKMTADIDLGSDQTMIGTSEKPFKGTFDVDGHTLIIAYNVTEDYVAPFRIIGGATIKKLHVTGTINTTAWYAGGIAGNVSFGTNYISQVHSSVSIIGNNTGSDQIDWHGGFAGQVIGSGVVLNLNDCLFTGSITGSSSSDSFCANMIGILRSSGMAYITNCLSTASFSKVCQVNSMYHYIHGSGSTTNSYVLKGGIITDQGRAGSVTNEEALANGTVTTALQANRSEKVWIQNFQTNQPMLKVFAEPYTLTFNPAEIQNMTVKVDDIDVTENIDANGNLADVRTESTVTLTATKSYKFNDVKKTGKNCLIYEYTGTDTWYGLQQSTLFTWAVQYTPSMLAVGYLTKVETTSRSTNPVTLKVYSGGDAPDAGELIATQVYETPAANSSYVIEFVQPVEIDPTKNLWITLTQESDFAACVGRYPTDPTGKIWYRYGNGDWYSTNSYTAKIYAHFLSTIPLTLADDSKTASFDMPASDVTISYELEKLNYVEVQIPAKSFVTYRDNDHDLKLAVGSEGELYGVNSVTDTEVQLTAQLESVAKGWAFLIYNSTDAPITALLEKTTGGAGYDWTGDNWGTPDCTNGVIDPASESDKSFYVCNGKQFVKVLSAGMLPEHRWTLAINEGGSNARRIVFGDATGIEGLIPAPSEGERAWYTLDGRKLNGKPTKPGIYVKNGQKVAVK